MSRRSFAVIGAPLGHVICVVVEGTGYSYQCECGCICRERAQLSAHQETERRLAVNDGHGARRS